MNEGAQTVHSEIPKLGLEAMGEESAYYGQYHSWDDVRNPVNPKVLDTEQIDRDICCYEKVELPVAPFRHFDSQASNV